MDVPCQPVKFGFNAAIPANYDVDLLTVFPSVSLPAGLDLQFLQNDGSLDTRVCLQALKSNYVWTVSTTSSDVSISYVNQASAPTVITPVWQGTASPGTRIPVKIDLVNSSNNVVKHTEST